MKHIKILGLLWVITCVAMACGGADPVEDPLPVEPAPPAGPTPEELAAAEQEQPLGGCEPAVQTTQGELLRCPGYNVIVGGWVQETPLALVDQARQGIKASQDDEPTDFGPQPLVVGESSWHGFVYAIGRSGKQRGYLVAVGDRQQRARLIHCMVEQAAMLERCQRGAHEIALQGQVPAHLGGGSRRAAAAEGAQTIVPRLHDEPLFVPKGCQVQGTQLVCEGSMLVWKEIASSEVARFEERYMAQLEAAVAQRLVVTKSEERACKVREQASRCRVLSTQDKEHGKGRVVVAPLKTQGQRAVIMCIDQPRRTNAPLAEVCAQLISWR